MDYDHVIDAHIDKTTVQIFAGQSAYEFRIDGAVCMRLDFDEIRIDSSDPAFTEVFVELMEQHARIALRHHSTRLGPIYCDRH